MLRLALLHIKESLNDYLNSKETTDDDMVVLDNVAKIESWNDSKAEELKDKIIISLVNVEEEKTLRNGQTTTPLNGSNVWTHNPVVHLNLYVLFCAHSDNYEFSLKYLSRVVTFFQKKNVFTPANSPGLDASIEKMIFDLNTVNMEQLNQLWGVLGGRYIPSVLYKMRMIALMEPPETMASVVTSIQDNEASL